VHVGGCAPLRALAWTRRGSAASGAPLWTTPVDAAALPLPAGGLAALRVGGHRATLARFPNALETDIFPAGWISSGHSWLPPAPGPTANETVTAVPGVSQPQMGLASFCWRTMWSPMMAGSLSSARAAGTTASAKAQRRRTSFFMGEGRGNEDQGGA
jgi:hypothetical protein